MLHDMDTKRTDDEYSDEESRQRFESALRGARMVGPKPRKGPQKPAKRKRKIRRKPDR
jgi:hypothetical protein